MDLGLVLLRPLHDLQHRRVTNEPSQKIKVVR